MYMRYPLADKPKSWYTPWLLAWVTLQDALPFLSDLSG